MENIDNWFYKNDFFDKSIIQASKNLNFEKHKCVVKNKNKLDFFKMSNHDIKAELYFHKKVSTLHFSLKNMRKNWKNESQNQVIQEQISLIMIDKQNESKIYFYVTDGFNKLQNNAKTFSNYLAQQLLERFNIVDDKQKEKFEKNIPCIQQLLWVKENKEYFFNDNSFSKLKDIINLIFEKSCFMADVDEPINGILNSNTLSIINFKYKKWIEDYLSESVDGKIKKQKLFFLIMLVICEWSKNSKIFSVNYAKNMISKAVESVQISKSDNEDDVNENYKSYSYCRIINIWLIL